MNWLQKIVRSRAFFSALIGLSVMGTVYFTTSYFYGEAFTESWEEIELNPILDVEGETVFPFEGDIGYQYFLQTFNKTRNARLNEMEAVYNEQIASLWQYYDEQRAYEVDEVELTNLYALNQRNWPTSWVEVDEPLYIALEKAYTVMELSNGHFNLFGGELHNYWDERFTGLSPELVDPAIDVTSAQELSDIVDALAVVASHSAPIEFDPITSAIRINVAKNDFISLDFQYIEEALAIEALNAYFINESPDDIGFFYTVDGYVLTRGTNIMGYQEYWSYDLLAPSELVNDSLVLVSLSGPQPTYSLTLTDTRHPSSYYYSATGDINNLDQLRHPYYSSITGYPSTTMRQINAVGIGTLHEDLALLLKWYNGTPSQWQTDIESLALQDIYVAILNTPSQSLSSTDYELYQYQSLTAIVEIEESVTIHD